MRRFLSLVYLLVMMMVGSVLSPFSPPTKNQVLERENATREPGSYSAAELSRMLAPKESSLADVTIEPKKPTNARKPDKPLQGRVICIDPGHQSIMKWQKVPIAPGESRMVRDFSIGTKGITTGVFEYEVVLQVSKKLRTALEKMGARVILTRERNDELVGSIERAEIANKAKADAFIRIHCDGLENPDVRGISVLYPGDRYIHDQTLLEESLALSQSLLEGAVGATQARNRGLMERHDLVGFNFCKVPCTLIEMGFMTNPEEDCLLNSESYQGKLVQGMVDGILNYLNRDD